MSGEHKHSKKHAVEVFKEKNCSEKFRSIHRKTPVLESLFSKVTGLKTCNFIKNRLQQSCFTLNIEKNFKNTYVKNICERLLLHPQSVNIPALRKLFQHYHNPIHELIFRVVLTLKYENDWFKHTYEIKLL